MKKDRVGAEYKGPQNNSSFSALLICNILHVYVKVSHITAIFMYNKTADEASIYIDITIDNSNVFNFL